ncbi:carboxynorspermidine decarboxylase [Marinibactrum halimedae]|uniref:Carboxynorspermidine/carboxyspermidine decarboxylase n=1 Tax=Marinibactrum halimedae TaxID=1444977 RepID=A0AA37T578_9GAMM|nr:carboxynorspermidine decarboxylase [Marinibactrum halimedae]MCD9459913.1 carboxynorspermidine decarboxylase [Marinibactrum halimedae]GLS25232.1 carboxynorspermidine/carboxyspermidine decarboxylase [Marinibactrum halimedae]
MPQNTFTHFDPHSVPSPCFVVDKVAIENNLKVLHHVQQASGAKVLAALKAFSFWHLAPLYKKYLSGTCASGYNEAKLGFDYYGGETHVFSAAFKPEELESVLSFADHVVFNSLQQWQRFQPLIQEALKARPSLDFGLRINPEHSEGTVPIYDPCAPCSRLGIPNDQLDRGQLKGISGLHFHTLCEQGFDPLDRTLSAVEEKFGDILPQLKWVNFGGGHHITADGYNIDALIQRIIDFRERYDVEVYLEPGEAIAIHTGVLVAEVLDITHNTMPLAILDTSATCHMPDTLEMPYRPEITGGYLPNEKAYTYRLGGMTCLAGDVMGDWSFEQPLKVGQRLIFEDMSHYTMVKTTTFNGINLPALAIWDSDAHHTQVVKTFGYDDFKNRLS